MENTADRSTQGVSAAVLAAIVLLLAVSGFALPLGLLLVLPVAAGLALLHRAGALAGGDLEFPPRPDWLSRGLLSGLVAGAAMLVVFFAAFSAAGVFGSLMGRSQSSLTAVQVGAWFFNLAHNNITDMAQRSAYLSLGLHFAMGLAFAALYGRYVEPRLTGPHWLRGVIFAAIPAALSVLVFFPLAGGGLLGLALGAGPLPLLGNLVLHAVYGATLGALYGPLGDALPGDEPADAEEVADLQHSESAAAKGIVGGMAAGLVAGLLMVTVFGQAAQARPDADVLGMVLVGGGFGALVGSMFGLPTGSGAAPRHRHV